MFDLLIAMLLGTLNSARARKKGKNSLLWIFLTVVCVIAGEIIGGFLTLFFFNNGAVNIDALSTGHVSREELTRQMATLYSDPVHAIFVLFCGLGGYLLIRFILDRMPDKTDGNDLLNNLNDPE